VGLAHGAFPRLAAVGDSYATLAGGFQADSFKFEPSEIRNAPIIIEDVF
jgi:hypothetical protein